MKPWLWCCVVVVCLCGVIAEEVHAEVGKKITPINPEALEMMIKSEWRFMYEDDPSSAEAEDRKKPKPKPPKTVPKSIPTKTPTPTPKPTPTPTPVPSPSPIEYHGGNVLSGPINLYLIWYGSLGTWTYNDRTVIENYLKNVSPNAGAVSGWWQMATEYYETIDGVTSPVTSDVRVIRSINVTNVQSPLSSNGLLAVIQNNWPNDIPAEGTPMFYVFTEPGIKVGDSGGYFCSSFCGWHTYGFYNNIWFTYSFIGHPKRCWNSAHTWNSCMASSMVPTASYPFGASAEAYFASSTIAHELVETATDPYFDGWLFPNGDENADYCAWTFGTTSYASAPYTNTLYNQMVNGVPYLIQQNWDITTGQCQVTA